MTIKSAPYYWVICNNCGKRHEEDFSAWDDPALALDNAIDSEWTTDGIRHNCPKCPWLVACEECGKPAGEKPDERDEQCQACWDKRAPA
jgi:hypothetical protein